MRRIGGFGRATAAALLLALLVLAATASPAAASPKVLVVGDSLEELTSPYLSRYLPGTELVVNAVLHGTRAGLTRSNPGAGLTVLRLCMLRRAGEVMLAVVDPGNETPMPRQPDWGGESGRGLQIVGALSHVWGWSPIAGHGKAVWAVLREL